MKNVTNLILLLVILFLMNEAAKAETITAGLIGGTYFSTPQPDKTVVAPELNLTYERHGYFYNLAVLNLEKDQTSFSTGGGVQWNLGEDTHIGLMAAAVFKHYDRPQKTNGDYMGNSDNFIPMSHRISLQPFLTLEHDIRINDSWAISMQAYVNNVAFHGSIGIQFKTFELGE